MAGLSRTTVCCLVGLAAASLLSACSQEERAAADPAPGAPPRAAQIGSPLAPSDLPCPVSVGYTTVIELTEQNGVCSAVTTGADKLETIRTYWGGIAEWEICNRCSQNVDIKLWRYSGDLGKDFWYTVPPFDVANEIELSNVGRHPDLRGRIMGHLKDGTTSEYRDYWVSWRVHNAGAWTDIDPRLEIEKGGLAWANSLVRWFTNRGGVR